MWLMPRRMKRPLATAGRFHAWKSGIAQLSISWGVLWALPCAAAVRNRTE